MSFALSMAGGFAKRRMEVRDKEREQEEKMKQLERQAELQMRNSEKLMRVEQGLKRESRKEIQTEQLALFKAGVFTEERSKSAYNTNTPSSLTTGEAADPFKKSPPVTNSETTSYDTSHNLTGPDIKIYEALITSGAMTGGEALDKYQEDLKKYQSGVREWGHMNQNILSRWGEKGLYDFHSNSYRDLKAFENERGDYWDVYNTYGADPADHMNRLGLSKEEFLKGEGSHYSPTETIIENLSSTVDRPISSYESPTLGQTSSQTDIAKWFRDSKGLSIVGINDTTRLSPMGSAETRGPGALAENLLYGLGSSLVSAQQSSHPTSLDAAGSVAIRQLGRMQSDVQEHINNGLLPNSYLMTPEELEKFSEESTVMNQEEIVPYLQARQEERYSTMLNLGKQTIGDRKSYEMFLKSAQQFMSPDRFATFESDIKYAKAVDIFDKFNQGDTTEALKIFRKDILTNSNYAKRERALILDHLDSLSSNPREYGPGSGYKPYKEHVQFSAGEEVTVPMPAREGVHQVTPESSKGPALISDILSSKEELQKAIDRTGVPLNINPPEKEPSKTNILGGEHRYDPEGSPLWQRLVETTEPVSPEEAEQAIEEVPEDTDKGLVAKMLETVTDVQEGLGSVDMWSELYQTDDSILNEAKFLLNAAKFSDGSAPQEEQIDRYSREAAEAFLGDFQKVKPELELEDITNILKQTAYHESLGGKYDEQMDGGPARGWWQVEPATAKDLLDDSDKAILIGPKAAKIIKAEGFTLEDLREMTDEQFAGVLKIPAINSVFAASKYATALQQQEIDKSKV